MLVTGFSLRDAIVAPEKGSFARSVGEIGVSGVLGGLGGSKSFAANQSSSANYFLSA
jgi:hypothetical protein